MNAGKPPIRRAIGLMSGTSLDGVDVALIETDGEVIAGFGPTGYRAYTPDERAVLARALDEAGGLIDRAARPPALAEAEAVVTRAHADAVAAFLLENDLSRADIAVIGFHGQTVLHRPALGLTVQLGDGAALARATGIPVIHDMRAADVAAGGQGAPLVPVFHRAIARMAGIAPPLAILNIGGVANVTFIFSDESMLAFDTGPGNALIDDLLRERLGLPYDDAGAIGARGVPEEPLIDWLMRHPYFAATPPKSLDRNWFSHRMVGHLDTLDAAATLTAFTLRSITAALDHAREKPARWIVAGGGARNTALCEALGQHLQTRLTPAEAAGWSGDHLEAQAFAYLAMRALRGLPITYPGTTGVAAPMTGGVLAEPDTEEGNLPEN